MRLGAGWSRVSTKALGVSETAGPAQLSEGSPRDHGLFDPRACLLDSVTTAYVADVWLSRFGSLAGEIERLGRASQAIEIARRVGQGELRYGQGERLSMFLDRESLGLVESFYPPACRL
jgi:hypothetical protein